MQNIKICFISDTHNKHNKIIIPKCDILVHAGDYSFLGKEWEIKDVANWFKKLKKDEIVREIVTTPGNHDWGFEKEPLIFRELFKDIHYLEDSEIELMGLKMYASPVTPFFCNWAFNRFRGSEIKKYWDNIPKNLDILITHGPPYGILDKNPDGKNCGCEELLSAVKEKTPKFHIFGHIHGGYGIEEQFGIKFINASICTEDYKPTNKPIVITI